MHQLVNSHQLCFLSCFSPCLHARPLAPELPDVSSMRPAGGGDQPGVFPPDGRSERSLWHDCKHGKSAALLPPLIHSSHSLPCSIGGGGTASPSAPIQSSRFRIEGGTGATSKFFRAARARHSALCSQEGGQYEVMFTPALSTGAA